MGKGAGRLTGKGAGRLTGKGGGQADGRLTRIEFTPEVPVHVTT
jgi:hypothetical protein